MTAYNKAQERKEQLQAFSRLLDILDDLREKLAEAGDNPRKLLNLRQRIARDGRLERRWCFYWNAPCTAKDVASRQGC